MTTFAKKQGSNALSEDAYSPATAPVTKQGSNALSQASGRLSLVRHAPPVDHLYSLALKPCMLLRAVGHMPSNPGIAVLRDEAHIATHSMCMQSSIAAECWRVPGCSPAALACKHVSAGHQENPILLRECCAGPMCAGIRPDRHVLPVQQRLGRAGAAPGAAQPPAPAGQPGGRAGGAEHAAGARQLRPRLSRRAPCRVLRKSFLPGRACQDSPCALCLRAHAPV